MGERNDETQDQFDQAQSQEPAEGGHAEEVPGGQKGGGGDDKSGAKPHADESDSADRPGSRAGAAGEGTQSTGHPGNAG